jgi:transcriptional regulator with XRE-family HTH domain
MDLGNSIKQYRIKKGYKQNELADKCDMTQAYLSKIENNQKEPALSILKTIASALEVPLPVLFFMAMSVEDIEPKKREAFKIIEPSIKGMIQNFF